MRTKIQPFRHQMKDNEILTGVVVVVVGTRRAPPAGCARGCCADTLRKGAQARRMACQPRLAAPTAMTMTMMTMMMMTMMMTLMMTLMMMAAPPAVVTTLQQHQQRPTSRSQHLQPPDPHAPLQVVHLPAAPGGPAPPHHPREPAARALRSRPCRSSALPPAGKNGGFPNGFVLSQSWQNRQFLDGSENGDGFAWMAYVALLHDLCRVSHASKSLRSFQTCP